MKTMGERIRQKRTECGLTQEELGKKLVPPVKRQAICKWEKGEVTEFKRSYIQQMSSIFRCKPEWLMNLDDAPSVRLTYDAPGKEPVHTLVDQDPIIGESSLRTELYKVALKVKPENLPVAIDLLNTLT